MKSEFINREISWLSFNERVLQESFDATVPLVSRIRFLGIYENNLDEFYRVRVATLRRAIGISKKPIDPMDFNPDETLKEIQHVVARQHERFEKTYGQLIAELGKKGFKQINEKTAKKEHLKFLRDHFTRTLKPWIVPVIVHGKTPLPQFSDNKLMFVAELDPTKTIHQHAFAIIELPEKTNRFILLPSSHATQQEYIFCDDILRLFAHELFPSYHLKKVNVFAIKTVRDAELDIDDDVSKSIVEKMSRSLNQRKRGQYVRIMYDRSMPLALLEQILKKLKSKDTEYITAGGRYQQLRDLMQFPDFNKPELRFTPLKTVVHPSLKDGQDIFSQIKKKDILLHYPYHSFDNILDLLRESAIDPEVRTIRITLYRVARNSSIISALINAARNGKRVLAVVELQARFDEENNISVSKALQEAGVRVIPGVPGLKVHCKLIQISRKEGVKTVRYVHIGTGNFHEGTASVYSDLSLLTANVEIGNEVRRIFEFFENNFQRSTFRHIVLSPFSTRRKFSDLISHEISLAEKGKPAWITIKMNNLVDASMINKLYEAAEAGVKVNLIIRGICSLIPDLKKNKGNIRVVSIVGRFLEHSRIISFGNGGNPVYYISSADWMVRNIDHRIEVTAPIYDPELKKDLQNFLDIQLSNSAKARIVEKSLKNEYLVPPRGRVQSDTQNETYKYILAASRT
ncbi:MAG: polyphosphate kinase 1 [Flavobacteriales bacterium]|nr:polyphosphate kinase 1 [Flavobacteriales bacterium]